MSENGGRFSYIIERFDEMEDITVVQKAFENIKDESPEIREYHTRLLNIQKLIDEKTAAFNNNALMYEQKCSSNEVAADEASKTLKVQREVIVRLYAERAKIIKISLELFANMRADLDEAIADNERSFRNAAPKVSAASRPSKKSVDSHSAKSVKKTPTCTSQEVGLIRSDSNNIDTPSTSTSTSTSQVVMPPNVTDDIDMQPSTSKAAALRQLSTWGGSAKVSSADAAWPSTSLRPLTASSGFAQKQIDKSEKGGEQRFCICNDVSYGEMIACDNKDCPYEWFHFKCINYTRQKVPKGKWYCPHCKVNNADKHRKKYTRKKK